MRDGWLLKNVSGVSVTLNLFQGLVVRSIVMLKQVQHDDAPTSPSSPTP